LLSVVASSIKARNSEWLYRAEVLGEKLDRLSCLLPFMVALRGELSFLKDGETSLTAEMSAYS
jgi:hypothetical protein